MWGIKLHRIRWYVAFCVLLTITVAITWQCLTPTLAQKLGGEAAQFSVGTSRDVIDAWLKTQAVDYRVEIGSKRAGMDTGAYAIRADYHSKRLVFSEDQTLYFWFGSDNRLIRTSVENSALSL
jgi:hypothetical protein